MFVPQLLEDVPEITSSFSGQEGFNRHFDEMLGALLTGMYFMHGIDYKLESKRPSLYLLDSLLQEKCM